MPVRSMLDIWIEEAHRTAVNNGWWEKDRELPELLALVHSEVSEALEEYRKNMPISVPYNGFKSVEDPFGRTIYKPEGVPAELADILIRIFDICGRYNIDLTSVVEQKLHYNKYRTWKHGGKIA